MMVFVIPALIDNAADEMIRCVTPVRHFLRHARQDFTLGTRLVQEIECCCRICQQIATNRKLKIRFDST
jgi:hypothetical protein